MSTTENTLHKLIVILAEWPVSNQQKLVTLPATNPSIQLQAQPGLPYNVSAILAAYRISVDMNLYNMG